MCVFGLGGSHSPPNYILTMQERVPGLGKDTEGG